MIKRLKYLLLGSPDRIITLISIIVGISGLSLSMYVYNHPNILPAYIIIRDNIIVLTLLLIVIALSFKYIKKYIMVENFRELVGQSLAIHHHIIHNFRDHYFWDLRNEFFFNPNMDLEQIDNLKKTHFENTCRTILSDTRDAFLKYYSTRGFRVGDDLTVTVKIIIEAEDARKILNAIKGEDASKLKQSKLYMVTGYRDPNTWGTKPERTEIMQIIYNIDEENTTFDELVNKGENFFLSNNLKKDNQQKKYKNQNPNWQNSYNSVLAVPIRYRRQNDHRASLIYGIISVDSLNPYLYELFDKENTFHLLAASADLLAMMFGNFDLIQLVRGATKQ